MTEIRDNSETHLPHQLAAGTLLCSRYRIGRVLGEGGFGITYEGWDKTLEIRVAVKEYFPKALITRHSGATNDVTVSKGETQAQFEKGKASFLTEARNIARFQNDPSIIFVSNFFEENGTAYIVMEFLDGRDLKDVLEEKGSFTFEETFRLLEPIMVSLQALHESGLIHRDISPSNIRILPDGRAKLLDFGAARTTNFRTGDPTSVLWKLGYSPIEQYGSRGEQGPWTDVYALSATMYHMLVGFPPDDAPQRVLLDEVKLPSALGADIPPEAEKVLMKGLAVQGSDRYPSVKEMTEAFRACRSGKRSDPKTKPERLPWLSLVPIAGLLCLIEMWKRTKRKRFLSSGRFFLAGFGICWLAFCLILLADICSLSLVYSGFSGGARSFFNAIYDHSDRILFAGPFLFAFLLYLARQVYVFSIRKDYERYRKASPAGRFSSAVTDRSTKQSLVRWTALGAVPVVFGFSGTYIGKKLPHRELRRLGILSLFAAFLLQGICLFWLYFQNQLFYLNIGIWRSSLLSSILSLCIALLFGTALSLYVLHLTADLLAFPDFFRSEGEKRSALISRYPNLSDRAWQKENSRWKTWTWIPVVGGVGMILAGKRTGRKPLILEGILLLAANVLLLTFCGISFGAAARLSYFAAKPVLFRAYSALVCVLPILWLIGICLGATNRFEVLSDIAADLGPYYSRAEKEIAEDGAGSNETIL